MKYGALFIVLWFCSALSLQAQPSQKKLRMITYNIQHGEGMDKKTDYERLGNVIKRYNPDVVAIQEIDSATSRSKGADVLREIANEALMYPYFAPAIDYQGGKYGVGILAKEKPVAIKTVPLPGRKEARVLLIAEFKDYVFCSTHFSLAEDEQEESVSILSRELSGYDKPVFLGGDLNFKPDSSPMEKLKQSFKILSSDKGLSFPADEPKVCIDYIIKAGKEDNGLAVLSTFVINEPMASDHRPVFVEVALQAEITEIFRTRPYLQNPLDKGITISWLTNVSVYSWVEYGKDTTNLTKAHTLVDGQVISNNYIHKIRLENINPGETYYYRVCSREILSYRAYSKVFGETAISEFYTFRIPEEKDTDFTALIFNDIHKNYKTLDAMYEKVKDIDYDFVIFNGDCIDDPADEAQAVRSLSYYNDKVGAARVPVFYIRGNHEIRNAYSMELRDLFDYVGNKTYGAFNWGDTRFVMLDCGEDKEDTHWVYYGLNDFSQLRNDQVDFLKEEVKSKEFKKANKRVLVHHIPLYGNSDKYRPCSDLWCPILAKAPFNVSIAGHTHRYAYHPKGSAENNFPAVTGGGPSVERATVMVLTKKGNDMKIQVINPEKGILLEETL